VCVFDERERERESVCMSGWIWSEREREWMYVQGAKNCACNDSNCFFTCHLAKMLAQNLPRHGASIFFSHTPLTKPKLQSADADM